MQDREIWGSFVVHLCGRVSPAALLIYVDVNAEEKIVVWKIFIFSLCKKMIRGAYLIIQDVCKVGKFWNCLLFVLW